VAIGEAKAIVSNTIDELLASGCTLNELIQASVS
jgi:hypothetical protein